MRDGIYDYLLQIKVSNAELMKARSDLLIVVLLLGLVSAFLSYFFARYIALKLVARLQRLNNQVKANLNRTDDVEPLETTGSDELTELSKSFNELMDTRERYRKEHIGMERVQAQTKRREELAQVAAQVSHDIKPPLETLLTMLRESKNLSEEKRNKMIKSVVTRIEQISNDLLHSKSCKEGVPTSTFVAPVMKAMVDEKRISLRENEAIAIHLDLGSLPCTNEVPLAPTTLERVLSNLLDNSIRSVRERGGNRNIWIKVSSASRNGDLQIDIIDNGCGMDPDKLEKVRFGAGSFDGGCGLGLSFARTAVTSIGGRLEIQSEENAGTSISLFIPTLNKIDQISDKWPPDLVLIDNDDLVRENWTLEAENAGVNLLCVSESEIIPWNELPKCTPIYVDKNLGSGRSGIDVYKSLAEMGFEKIVLCTADINFQLPSFIKEIASKQYPKKQFVSDGTAEVNNN